MTSTVKPDGDPAVAQTAPLPAISLSSPDTPPPWGFWATVGWSVICIAGVYAAQIFLGVAIGVGMQVLLLKTLEDSQRFLSGGVFVSVGTIAGAIVSSILVVTFTCIRRTPVREYLGMRRFRIRDALIGIALLLGFVLGLSALLSFLKQSPSKDFILSAYRTAGSPILLFFAMVLCAPVYEELLFRGFMFRGIAASRAGPLGAVVITSLPWALLHVQYGAVGMGVVFGLGLLLGGVRWATGSTTLAILLHVINNLLAFAEVVILVEVAGR